MKTKTYTEGYPGDAEFAIVDDVMNVNHKPHVPVIGTKHVVWASDHNGGMLSGDCPIPCAHPGCQLRLDQHTSDRVAFVKLQRNTNNAEMQEWMKSLLPWTEKHKIDGFCFVENKGYRVSK